MSADAAAATAPRLAQYERMARAVWGKPFDQWPAWSTGETLIVALLLNRADVLDALSYTIIEAVDRIDLTIAELRAIERRLQA